MKAHTNNFKTNIALLGRQLDSVITYTLNGTKKTLGVEQLNSVTPMYEGAMFKSVMKQLNIDSNVDIPIGTKINYKFGVLVGNAYEYLDFGDYIVKESQYNEDNKSYSIECYDLLLNSMVEYSKLNIVYPITIKDYIKAICTRINLEFKDSNFVNANKLIYSEKFLYEDGSSLGYTYRDVLDQLAQITGSCICIDKDNKVEVRYITNTNDTINEDYFNSINVTFGKKYGPVNSLVFSRSEDSDNIYLDDEESISLNGLCELKISDNEILNDDNRGIYLTDLFNAVKGLEYYVNDYSSPGICYYDLLDRYTVSIGDNTYSCVMLNDEINITQGLSEDIYTIMPSEAQTDYTKSDKEDNKIRKTSFIVDKQNGKINALVSNFSELTGTNYSEIGYVEYKNVLSGEPKYIEIHPIQENISYIYPSSGLFPQESLYPKQRLLRFTNKTTNEVFEYEIPDDLLYFSSEYYDTLVIDKDKNLCYITKKCKLNNNEEVEVLDTETTKYYDYPTINLTYGDYIIEIVGYEIGYILTTLLASGSLADTYATKTELEITDEKATITSEKVGTIETELQTSYDKTGNPIEINNAGNYNLTKFIKKGKCVKSGNTINTITSPYNITIKHSNSESETVSIEFPKENLYKLTDKMIGMTYSLNQTSYKYEFIEDSSMCYTYIELEPNTYYTISRDYISSSSYSTFKVALCDDKPEIGGQCTILAGNNKEYKFFNSGEHSYLFVNYANASDSEEELIRKGLKLYNGLSADNTLELNSVENGTASVFDEYDGVNGILIKKIGKIDEYNEDYEDLLSKGYICDTDELEEDGIVYYVLEEPIEYQLEIPTIMTYKGYNKISDNDSILTSMQISYLTDSKLNKEFTSRAEFTVKANEIDSKVSQDDIIADLNVAIKDGKGVITLTGDKTIIDSDNFSVDGDGKITATSGEIGGFKLGEKDFNTNISGIYNFTYYDASIVSSIVLKALYNSNSIIKVFDVTGDGEVKSNDQIRIGKILDGTVENTHIVNCEFNINSNDPKNCVTVKNENDVAVSLGVGGVNTNMLTAQSGAFTTNDNVSTPDGIFINGDNKKISIYDNGLGICFIEPDGIVVNKIETEEIRANKVYYMELIPYSQEDKKKNFEKFENGLDIINSTEIYKYNYKEDEDTDKKHIGFIIGENYKYSQEITSKENNGVDLYSFVSVCCKAIQEQQTQIEELKQEINKLKESEK